MGRAKALIVWGTGSGVGKSLFAAGLLRHFKRLGLEAAPFKAQNMANHARVVRGGEMASAQWLQALAAGVEPEVRMNPVLVKPFGERGAQVVVWGKVDPFLSGLPWKERRPHPRPPSARPWKASSPSTTSWCWRGREARWSGTSGPTSRT